MSGPFDRRTISSVASAVGVSERDLADAAESVQSALEAYPAVDLAGLVYEWRQAFAEDPLVEETATKWVLRVPERVWNDAANRAGVRDSLRPALRALHATETPAGVEDEEDDDQERVTLVVSRL